MKYIYFEVHKIYDNEPIIKNFNGLINKPEDTDIYGIRLFKNINKTTWIDLQLGNLEQIHVVEQYWIDLQKYDFEYQKGTDFDRILMQVLELLNLR